MRPYPQASYQGIHFVEDPQGEWVKYEDVKDAVDLLKRMKEAEKRNEELAKIYGIIIVEII